MNQLSDAPARHRIQHDLDTTLFVEAAAGTGKTTALVTRIISLLRSGRSTLDKIVAVTFTEKAAGEMKLRLREEIERRRSDSETTPEELARFELALEHLEVAKIGTIHSFCADILNQRPVEATVDPAFEVATEDESEKMIHEVFDSWFQRTLDDPPEGIRRVLRRRRYSNSRGPRDLIRRAVTELVKHRDFPAAWRRDPFDRNTAIDRIVPGLREVGRKSTESIRPDDYLARNLETIHRCISENDLREQLRGRDYDALEAELRELAQSRNGWHWRGFGDQYSQTESRSQVIQQRDQIKVQLDEYVAAADADLAACLHAELRPVVELYEATKLRDGRLDFLDLLNHARNLIRDDATVRNQLQQQWTHFFIDEFQDTDPLQVELLMLLAADEPQQNDYTQCRPLPGKLFVVGDPKQSIYRFRRADVGLYQATREALVEHGAVVLQLQTSFRSVPQIQQLVNHAFESRMVASSDGGQAEYFSLHEFRPEIAEQPSVIALPVPKPYGDFGKVNKYAIDRSYPDAVGGMIQWLINDSGWKVSDPDDPKTVVQIAAKHVCVLFRRFRHFRDDVTRPYIRSLEARRIPHVLVGGHSFHQREEVQAIRNALNAIEWPDDKLHVFATLRGPLFAISDDTILSYRSRIDSLHPLRRLTEEQLDELNDDERQVDAALTVLSELHYHRNRRPIAETITRLMHAVRAHAGIAIWPTGEQSLANCLRLVDRARRFERQGATSFRAFVERLDDEAEQGSGDDAPVVEAGTEGVRIMTVHKAKGLEFPIVILADPTCNATRFPPSQFVDTKKRLFAESLCGASPIELLENQELEAERESAEAIRVAYVAATRARDLLILPTVGDESSETADPGWWLDATRSAVYPTYEDRRNNITKDDSLTKHGLHWTTQAFGKDSVLWRHPKAGTFPSDSVKPGLHTSANGNPIVWWDVRTLDLDVEENIGLRQHLLLQADDANVVAEEGVKQHQAWADQRDQALQVGAQPSVSVKSVTELSKQQAASPTHTVVIHQITLNRSGRPKGKRFGVLVHTVLATIPFDATDDEIAKTVRARARLVNAPATEITAAITTVSATLQDSFLKRAAASHQLGLTRRESPVLLKTATGQLVEGVVDLAFRETIDDRNVWTVIDFKTDREISRSAPIYQSQVSLYLDAIAAATGEEVQGVLLVV